jgi:hypothetical protein
MNDEKPIEAQIARHEEWLRRQSSPMPTPDQLAELKLAVRSEAAMLALSVDKGPSPAPAILKRVKSAVRAEALRHEHKRRWTGWQPLAAAAVLAVAVVGPWSHVPDLSSTRTTAGADPAIEEFVIALGDAFDVTEALPADAAGATPPRTAELEVHDDSELALDSVIWELQTLLSSSSQPQTTPG